MCGVAAAAKKTVAGQAVGELTKKPKVPGVVQRDPEAEAQRAADEAARLANAETASRKRNMQRSSLLSSGGARGLPGMMGDGMTSVLARGKTTLGS